MNSILNTEMVWFWMIWGTPTLGHFRIYSCAWAIKTTPLPSHSTSWLIGFPYGLSIIIPSKLSSKVIISPYNNQSTRLFLWLTWSLYHWSSKRCQTPCLALVQPLRCWDTPLGHQRACHHRCISTKNGMGVLGKRWMPQNRENSIRCSATIGFWGTLFSRL